MRHEIAFAGLFLPSLLFCIVLAGALWIALDRLLLHLGAWRFFWHPPLARLCLFFALVGLVSAFYPDF